MRLKSLLALCVTFMGLAGQHAWADLVANGNFATGDFTGWTSDASIVIDSAFVPPGDAYDAAFTGTGTLSQTIATAAGQEYTLSFSLLDESALSLDSFTVNFGGFSTTITGDTASTYQTEVFDIPGSYITDTNTILSFQGFNAFYGNWNLDDVSIVPVVAAVPEPSAGIILGGAVLMLLSLRLRRIMTQ